MSIHTYINMCLLIITFKLLKLYTNKNTNFIVGFLCFYKQPQQKDVKFPIKIDLPSFWQCTTLHELLMRYKVR